MDSSGVSGDNFAPLCGRYLAFEFIWNIILRKGQYDSECPPPNTQPPGVEDSLRYGDPKAGSLRHYHHTRADMALTDRAATV
jgi:hypothetical protein